MGRSGSRWVARKRIISHFPDHISTDHIKGNSIEGTWQAFDAFPHELEQSSDRP